MMDCFAWKIWVYKRRAEEVIYNVFVCMHCREGMGGNELNRKKPK